MDREKQLICWAKSAPIYCEIKSFSKTGICCCHTDFKGAVTKDLRG